MSYGNETTQPAGSIDDNMTAVDRVEGLDLKAMYATIATAQMMYEERAERLKLKADIEELEKTNEREV